MYLKSNNYTMMCFSQALLRLRNELRNSVKTGSQWYQDQSSCDLFNLMNKLYITSEYENIFPMTFLHFLYFYVLLFASNYVSCGRVWRDLTPQEIEDWYSPMEICMLELEDREMNYPREAQRRCEEKGFGHRGRNKGCPIGKGSNKFPCYPPYKDRKSFVRGVEGYTDAKAKPIANVIRALASRNMSIIFIGDSTMRQKMNALECEIMREDGRAFVQGDLKGILPCHSAHVIHMAGFQVPFHGISMGPNSVDCLKGGLHKRDPDGGGLYENAREIIRKINMEEQRGVLLLANMGLWYNDELPFQTALPGMFRWMAKVSEETAGGRIRNIVLWQETMAQHWPNAIGSGYYYRPYSVDVEAQRTALGTDLLKVPDWQVPGCCVHITNYTSGNDWRNELAEAELRRMQKGGRLNDPADPSGLGAGRHIELLRMFDLTAPIADMHVCSPLYHYDCTHYCFWPLMWQPLWHELDAAVRKLT